MEEVRISVRRLIEFVGRSGDIDRGFFSNARAMAGVAAHQKIQSGYGEKLQREVFLRTREETEEVVFIIEGRADGISAGETVVIDEIKSTTRSLEELSYNSNPLHWAQVKVYAYIYAKEHDLLEVTAQLTYFQLESEEIKQIAKTFSFVQLREFFMELIYAYYEFSKRIAQWKTKRNLSLKALPFPFSNYRKGQRQLAVAVYQAILEERRLFVEAPTGIGKTISTLFPAIKAIGQGGIDQIFYLVGRSTQKETVRETLYRLQDRGLRLKYLMITAKEKICFNDEVKCNPIDCPYAKGHYDRVGDAIMDIFDHEDSFTGKKVEQYAKLHQVCPFEFQLELANFSDCIIGDYNYVFDPAVYLRQFFESSLSRYLFLVDEAHNLVDRGREMYSAKIAKEDLEELIEEIPQDYRRIQKYLWEIREAWDNLAPGPRYQYPELTVLNDSLQKLMYSLPDFLSKEKNHPQYDRILELYFSFFAYQRLLEYYNEDFVTVIQDNTIKLLCLDTAGIFENILTRAKTGVFFSATLTPIKYYAHLLGGGKNPAHFCLDSPFAPEKLKVLCSKTIATTYRHRRGNIPLIVEHLRTFSQRQGNYIFFFPSYAFMEEVFAQYQKVDSQAVMQERNMSEQQRNDFLEQFTCSTDVRAFAVMGGVFGEGIDLVGNRLIGAAIVTVGIPQISYERNILCEHFSRRYQKGYEFAYMYPGMIKVAQSGGRVIRHGKDIGALLLIDLRFCDSAYQVLLPKHWRLDFYEDDRELERKISSFWNYWDKE